MQFFALAHVAKVGGSLPEKEVVALLAQLARGEYSFPASMSLEREELYSAACSIATTPRPLSDAEHSTPVLRKIKPSLRAATYDTRIANVASSVMGAVQSLLAEAAITSSLQTALTQRISVLAAKAGGNHNGGDDEEDDEVDDELDGDLFSNPTHHLSSLSKAVACAHALCQKSKFAAEQQFASAPLEKMSTRRFLSAIFVVIVVVAHAFARRCDVPSILSFYFLAPFFSKNNYAVDAGHFSIFPFLRWQKGT